MNLAAAVAAVKAACAGKAREPRADEVEITGSRLVATLPMPATGFPAAVDDDGRLMSAVIGADDDTELS